MTPTRKSERLKGRWPATETTDATSIEPAKNVAGLKRKNAPEAKPDPKDAKKQRIEDPNLGKLERMDEIPLDVLYEIFSYLHPLDLLHISRAAKMFRNALYTKSSVYAWANAFDNVGLDSRGVFEDLNQPQLARLLFEKRCSNCSGPGPKRVIWQARIRLCKKCLLEWNIMQPVNMASVDVEVTDENKHRIPLIYAVTPKHIVTRDLDPVTFNRIRKAIPHDVGTPYWQVLFYHTDSFRKLWEESAPMSEEEFKEWYEGEKEYYEELKDEAKQLHDYAVSYDEELAYQKQKRWQKRLDSVVMRLKAEGFEKEFEDKYSNHYRWIQRHPNLWTGGGALTDEEWSEFRESYTYTAGLKAIP